MKVVLVQLPIPKINFGLKTGNIPLGAACLKQAAAPIHECEVEILPENLASYGGDQVIISAIVAAKPDIVGFTLFSWNRDRSVHLAMAVKQATGAKIVFGGPEITEETIKDLPDIIDFSIMGEGETLFKQLLVSKTLWKQRAARDAFGKALTAFSSPYLNGHLDLGKDGVMLIETQRGCPYRCGFCFYSKAGGKRQIADDRLVLAAIAWAMDNGVEEIYLMDPSLNARPGLAHLLKEITRINRLNTIPITSEIRAESVTPELAEWYMKAGFTSFEVGLQSTNPSALKLMNRPTRLDRFIKGIKALRHAGIHATIDLIFGLPGDTPTGFRQTVDFIIDHGFETYVQVFPLLVLPGTDFRRRSAELGLDYAPHPPYPIRSTPGFSARDLVDCLDYAEDRFDRSFYPLPDLDLSFQPGSAGPAGDCYVTLANQRVISKLVMDRPRSLEDIAVASRKTTSPFQLFFGRDACDSQYIRQVVALISKANPFIPLEVVFIEPVSIPDTNAFLSVMAIKRPHFLDLDQHYLYPEPGNRSVLFTLVSKRESLIFQGPMNRQVFLWTRPSLPGQADLETLSDLDGILIDSPVQPSTVHDWQNEMAGSHEELMLISFSQTQLQSRWVSLTTGDQYQADLFEPLT